MHYRVQLKASAAASASDLRLDFNGTKEVTSIIITREELCSSIFLHDVIVYNYYDIIIEPSKAISETRSILEITISDELLSMISI